MVGGWSSCPNKASPSVICSRVRFKARIVGIELEVYRVCDWPCSSMVWRNELRLPEQNNAPFYATKHTSVSLTAMGIAVKETNSWCDPNPTGNLWSILKQKVHEGGRHFTSKQQLWEAILASYKEIHVETFQKITSSMDPRIANVISKIGSYINI